MKIDFGAYNGVRARLQRLADCTLFEGWVTSISEERIVVRIRSDKAFSPNDEFFCELIGKDNSVQMALQFVTSEDVDLFLTMQIGNTKGSPAYTLMEARDLDYDFIISQVLRFTKTNEPYRRRVDEMGATIHEGDLETEVDVVDIGLRGIGVMSPSEFFPGTDIDISVDSQIGRIRMAATVRRCNKPRLDDPRYFVGLEVKPSSRIDTARWERFIGGRAA